MKRWRIWRIFRVMRPLARLFDSGRRRAAWSEDSRIDDLGSFGWLPDRGDRAFMLEVRHKTGDISAFNYSTLDQAEFDSSDGIKLTFYPCTTVKIAGRNINDEVRPNVRLFAGILRHRVPWIQEANEPTAMEAPKGATVIDEVEVK
jgi:hypothetical protein